MTASPSPKPKKPAHPNFKNSGKGNGNIAHGKTAAIKKAEEAFLVYLNLGKERSLVKLSTVLKQEWGSLAPQKSVIDKWSGQYQWQQRVADHDQEVAVEAERQLVKQEAAEIVRRRNATLHATEGMRRMVSEYMVHEVIDPDTKQKTVKLKPFESLDPPAASVAARWLKTSRDLELREYGVPDQTIKHTGDPLVDDHSQHVTVLGREALTELFYFFADPETAREADIAEEMAQAARQQQLLPNQPVIEGELTGDLD